MYNHKSFKVILFRNIIDCYVWNFLTHIMFTKNFYKFSCGKFVLEKHIDINNIKKSQYRKNENTFGFF